MCTPRGVPRESPS
ncbi:unnamed protein product, partial [Didymodactylos carnosus]